MNSRERTQTKKHVVDMESARILRTSDAEKLLADLHELESLQMKRQVLQEFTFTVIRSENLFFTSSICPSFAENKSNQHTSRLCVTHEEFMWCLRKGAFEESELAKGHIVLCLDCLDELAPRKQRWGNQSFPEQPVPWILEQFDVFNVCR